MDRLTPSERKTIHNDPRPVRVIAEEKGRSKTTVQKWKTEEDFEDKPRVSKACRGVDQIGVGVFAELLKLSRFRYQKLFEFLAPVWSTLPTQDRIDCKSEGAYWRDHLTGKFVNTMIHPTTYYRQLKTHSEGKVLQCFDRKASKGSVGVHRVRVRWANQHREEISGEILLFIERHTGLIFARSFLGNVAIGSFTNTYSQFAKMLPYKIRTLSFVASDQSSTYKQGNWVRRASLPMIKSEEQFSISKSPQQISQKSLNELRDHFFPQMEAFLDPGSTKQVGFIKIPGQYSDRWDLDHTLAKFCNLLNFTPRIYSIRGRLIQMSPFEQLRKELDKDDQQRIRGQLARRIKISTKVKPKI